MRNNLDVPIDGATVFGNGSELSACCFASRVDDCSADGEHRTASVPFGQPLRCVLLIVAPRERKVRIEVGYGLEPVLTDALSALIIQNEILPAFREGDFERGIEQGVDAIDRQLRLDPVEAQTRAAAAERPGSAAPLGIISPIGVIFLLLLLAMIGGAGGRGRRRAGGVLHTLLWAAALAATRENSGGGIGGGSSGGGFGGGGGGFGGGGGSFGGGGASGGW